ncbi:MAG: efflux RND transporter periplasmic adaptor subunit [Sandaracinaceae bacterium]|nr:efflux RND transporter periplasmic adaptor subunit [Sandaracinaceae bacterium]
MAISNESHELSARIDPAAATASPPSAPAQTDQVRKPAPPAPLRRLRRKRRRWIYWLVAILAVGVGIWWYTTARQTKTLTVSATAVTRGSVRDFVTSVAAGRVSARYEATIRAPFGGTVATLRARRGDSVAAGAVVLTYDVDELRERLQLARAGVTLARAQVGQAEENERLAMPGAIRARRLHQSGAIAIADLERAEGQVEVAERAADAARAALSQARANVELSASALSRAEVRAPTAGVIVSTEVEVGEITAAGQPLFLLADTSEFHVDAELDEADVGRVAVGMAVDVVLDAFPNERVRGRVSEIAPSITRDAHGGRSATIEVALPSDPRLRVGMSADVDVIVEVRENVLWVPPNAVSGRGAERSVYVVRDGIAHKRSVTTGVSTWEAAELLSGLREGELVLTTLGVVGLADGAHVRVAP